MNLTFLGAAGEVTGSCYLLEVGATKILIDGGMFQGGMSASLKNMRPLSLPPSQINAIVLTHAHLDHTGRLPKIVHDGFSGRIFCTPPTVAMSELVLKDAAHLQDEEVQRLNRRRCIARGTCKLSTVLFDESDVVNTVKRFSIVPYNKVVTVAPGITARFVDAGHILGSGSVEIICQDNGRERTIVFSGDVGSPGMPLLKDPTRLPKADVIVLESTYGDRDHRPLEQTKDELRTILRNAVADRGMVLIPAFAIGRTQSILVELAELRHEGAFPGNMPVIVDSPMAIAVTRLYETYRDLWDTDVCDILGKGCNPLRFPNLRMSQTADDSRKINSMTGPAVIIAGAGMCNGGRIVHHLRHNLGKPNTHVIIPGYQSVGTLGRRLVEGEKNLTIWGEKIDVKAHIHTVGGLSAHAGRSVLLAWPELMMATKPTIFLTHGEDGPRRALAQGLRDRYGVEARMPMLGDRVSV